MHVKKRLRGLRNGKNRCEMLARKLNCRVRKSNRSTCHIQIGFSCSKIYN